MARSKGFAEGAHALTAAGVQWKTGAPWSAEAVRKVLRRDEQFRRDEGRRAA